MINIKPIPAFTDNYIWCLCDTQNNTAIVVDPGDAKPVITHLEKWGLALEAIIITHHHPDHTGGIDGLTRENNIPVYGPHNPAIPQITQRLKQGEVVALFGHAFEVIEVPGHTLDHIAFYSQQLKTVFCGDTLFAGGCGRIFEGNPAMMLNSLNKLATLPADTAVYCAHEYTMANLNFAKAVESENPELQARIKVDSEARQNNMPTVPSTIAIELNTNPFLRSKSSHVIAAASRKIGKSITDPVDVFATIRSWKDSF